MATVGFDGVHIGHRHPSSRLSEAAPKPPSAVITFPVHPQSAAGRLSTSLLSGFDEVAQLATTDRLLHQSFTVDPNFRPATYSPGVKENPWDILLVGTIIGLGITAKKGIQYRRHGKGGDERVAGDRVKQCWQRGVSSSQVRRLFKEGQVKEVASCSRTLYLIG